MTTGRRPPDGGAVIVRRLFAYFTSTISFPTIRNRSITTDWFFSFLNGKNKKQKKNTTGFVFFFIPTFLSVASCGDNRFLFFNGIISIPLIFRRSLRHLHHFSWLYVELNPIEAFDGPLVLSWKPNLSQLGTGKTFEPKSFLVIFAYRSYFCFVFFCVCLFVFTVEDWGGSDQRPPSPPKTKTQQKKKQKKLGKNTQKSASSNKVDGDRVPRTPKPLFFRSSFSFSFLDYFTEFHPHSRTAPPQRRPYGGGPKRKKKKERKRIQSEPKKKCKWKLLGHGRGTR